MIEFEILWLVAFLLFLVIELITLDINVLWFIGGSSVALIVSMLGASLPIQIVTFIVFTVLSYKGTKNMKPEKTRTNSDAVIGKKGVVIRDITEMNPGQVRVQDATIWSAISKNPLSEGDEVEIIAIEGVKLIVKKLKD